MAAERPRHRHQGDPGSDHEDVELSPRTYGAAKAYIQHDKQMFDQLWQRRVDHQPPTKVGGPSSVPAAQSNNKWRPRGRPNLDQISSSKPPKAASSLVSYPRQQQQRGSGTHPAAPVTPSSVPMFTGLFRCFRPSEEPSLMLDASARRVALHHGKKTVDDLKDDERCKSFDVERRIRAIKDGLPSRPHSLDGDGRTTAARNDRKHTAGSSHGACLSDSTSADNTATADECPGAASSNSALVTNNVAPSAPLELALAYRNAFQDMTTMGDDVLHLFSHNAQYTAPGGKQYVGRAAIVKELNAGMAVLFDRYSSLMAVRGKSNTEVTKATHRYDVAGPIKRESNGTWLMTYTFSLLLVTYKLEDEFTVNDDGIITRLVRVRLN